MISSLSYFAWKTGLNKGKKLDMKSSNIKKQSSRRLKVMININLLWEVISSIYSCMK